MTTTDLFLSSWWNVSSGFSIDPAALVWLMRGPGSWGHCPGLGEYLCIGRFLLHLTDGFLAFFVNWLCTVHSFRPFWKWVRGIWGSLVVLIPPYCRVHFLPLIPALALYCGVFFLKEKCFSYLHLAPLLQPKLALSHSVLIPIVLGFTNSSSVLVITVLGWLHSHLVICVWDVHISPLSSGNWEFQRISLWTAAYRVVRQWALIDVSLL